MLAPLGTAQLMGRCLLRHRRQLTTSNNTYVYDGEMFCVEPRRTLTSSSLLGYFKHVVNDNEEPKDNGLYDIVAKASTLPSFTIKSV